MTASPGKAATTRSMEMAATTRCKAEQATTCCKVARAMTSWPEAATTRGTGTTTAGATTPTSSAGAMGRTGSSMSGQDTLSDYDATPGNTDVLTFGSNVSMDQLWFRHIGNTLEVSILGTDDKLTLNNWYSGNANHVEQFKTSDSKLLLDSQVDVLVAAMAAFAPPAPGQTSLPPDYQTALNPVIAANWK